MNTLGGALLREFLTTKSLETFCDEFQAVHIHGYQHFNISSVKSKALIY